MAVNIGPLPANVRSDLNMRLGSKEFAALDDNQRFIIRSLVWHAYEQGFAGGRNAEREDSWTDREVKREQEETRTAALKQAEAAHS